MPVRILFIGKVEVDYLGEVELKFLNHPERGRIQHIRATLKNLGKVRCDVYGAITATCCMKSGYYGR